VRSEVLHPEVLRLPAPPKVARSLTRQRRIHVQTLRAARLFPMQTDDHAENKPVWPTWAVGILSGVWDIETYYRGHIQTKKHWTLWDVEKKTLKGGLQSYARAGQLGETIRSWPIYAIQCVIKV
jgi:hypothetical protein